MRWHHERLYKSILSDPSKIKARRLKIKLVIPLNSNIIDRTGNKKLLRHELEVKKAKLL